uniref:Retrovirus-related Pol polyprotein from transposon TNT 1-94 n=1 Tax=Cajanus cajan TaxID=3821 RepID=A0A151SZ98_CAJCA|nr:Retrovirus-related Pol polyprotein from transposon TNT 1-94 [Cajanus cajan]
MDVKSIFLNGELEEEIYMTQPEGCVVLGQENKMCRLLKSLYGLKQAPKQWHENFDQVLIDDGFTSSSIDRCVYTKSLNDDCVIICLYVDEMLIFGTCDDIVFKTKSFLASKFDMKDMGGASVILGVKVVRKGDSILLS